MRWKRIESAWLYRYRPAVTVGVARELAGFIRAVGQVVERPAR